MSSTPEGLPTALATGSNTDGDPAGCRHRRVTKIFINDCYDECKPAGPGSAPTPPSSMALQKDSTAGLHSGPKRATGRSGSTEGQDRHWWDTGAQQEKGGTKGEMWGGIKWHPPPWV